MSAAKADAKTGGTPVAVASETEHDFGAQPVETAGEHTFLIRNEGTAPLELTQGATSCRCTLANLSRQRILPGESGDVKVTWTTRGQYFSQRAVVRTNDPRRKEIEFTVKGKVRHPLAATPADLVFASLRTGESQIGRVTLYSQIWDDFEITGIEASSKDVKWTVFPADPIALANLDARCGYELEVQSPALEEPGYFGETLQIQIRPRDPKAAAQRHTLAITGNVLSRIALYGTDEHRVVSFGKIPAGQSVQRLLTMRVRDQHAPISIERIETSPSFLKVACEPIPGPSREVDRYRISVEIPADAPLGDCSGTEKGHVLLVTNHPTEKQVRFEVAFEVVASPREVTEDKDTSEIHK